MWVIERVSSLYSKYKEIGLKVGCSIGSYRVVKVKVSVRVRGNSKYGKVRVREYYKGKEVRKYC